MKFFFPLPRDTQRPAAAQIREGQPARDPRWPRPAVADVLLGLSLFGTLLALRTVGVSDTMWLLGDQIRDWTIALGPASALPLTGPPSVAGGTSLGPIFYWMLWAIRTVIGGWFDNLPHAGVFGLALLHAAAEVVFFFALRKLSGSAVLALTIVLLLATSPYDLALSSTIWNPGPAVALVKLALALFMLRALHPSPWWMAATVGVAWIAVQTHSSAILVSLPLIVWFVVRDLPARRWSDSVQTTRLIIEIILVLQIPFIINAVRSEAPPQAPTMIAEGMAALFADPWAARPATSFDLIVSRIAYLWRLPFDESRLPWLLGAAAAGTVFIARRRPDLLFVTVMPLLTAVIGFAAWRRPMESYWFLALAPAVGLMIATAACAVPVGRARDGVALALLGVVLYAQPDRLRDTRTIHRLPEYGALIDGTREIVRHTREVGAVMTTFELPPSTDPAFPFVCMGGRLSPLAPYDALIAGDGSVKFRQRW